MANATDPGSVDISASLNGSLSVCSPTAGTPDIALDASDRPVLGTSINLITTEIPLSAVAGLTILSLNDIPGGVDLTFLGMPGCFVYQDLDVVLNLPVFLGTAVSVLSIPSTAALVGTEVSNQSVILDLNITSANMATS